MPFVDDFASAIKDTDHIVDAIFGSEPPISLQVLAIDTSCRVQFFW